MTQTSKKIDVILISPYAKDPVARLVEVDLFRGLELHCLVGTGTLDKSPQIGGNDYNYFGDRNDHVIVANDMGGTINTPPAFIINGQKIYGRGVVLRKTGSGWPPELSSPTLTVEQVAAMVQRVEKPAKKAAKPPAKKAPVKKIRKKTTA